MKKISVFIVVGIFFYSSFSYAKPIDKDKALKAANTFLVIRYPASDANAALTITKKGQSALKVKKEVMPLIVSSKLVGYVVDLEPAGFILFSGDDEMPPVKIYSNTGSYEGLPEGLKRVMELELLEDNTTITSTSKKSQHVLSKIKRFSGRWNYLTSDVNQNNTESFPTGAPGTTLLTTTWHQNDPYNYYCPVAAGGPGGRAYAGCTATALAQILRYHMMPFFIASDYTYSDNSGSCQGTHSVSDAGMGPYDWANMPSSISTSSPEVQKQAIGQLIYHCGVVLESDYEAGLTAAYPTIVNDRLEDRFKYTCDGFTHKNDYPEEQWYNKIIADIDNDRPIFYSMWEADWSDGHAVVCDGYRNGNEIHLNMGWSGAWDAWYNIDSVSASGYTWTIHGAVFKIAPIMPPPPPSSIIYPTDSNTGRYIVSWSSSTGASEYALQRSCDGGVSWLQIALWPTISYVDRVGNGSYRYRVQAINFGGASSWTTGTTDCLVSITFYPNGDINADYKIDFLDLFILTQQWLNTCAADTNWCSNADMDHTGSVDFWDFSILAGQWLTNDPRLPNDMVVVPAGTFQMGDSFSEGSSDEQPVHTVTVDSFFMGRYEITNSQYCDFLNSALSEGSIYYNSANWTVYDDTGNNKYLETRNNDGEGSIKYSSGIFIPRTKGGRNMSNDPVINVSWYGAAAYCNWRSQQELKEQCYNLSTWDCDFSKHGYRLATEAEWEYAARGGLSGKRFPWADLNITHSQANYYSNSSYSYDISPTRGYNPAWNDGLYPYTSPMGSFASTGYGLYDMAGNAFEWCNDWYSSSYYSSSPVNNPMGSISGTARVLRGGSWFYNNSAYQCRVVYRGQSRGPGNINFTIGFRVVLDFQ